MAARTNIDITKDDIVSLYYINYMTLREMGRIFGCCPQTIHYYMKKYDIPRRGVHIRPIASRAYTINDFLYLSKRKRPKCDGGFRQMLRPKLTKCVICGSKKNVHWHNENHEVLCQGCIVAIGRTGMVPPTQIQLCTEYRLGFNGSQLADVYHISKSTVYYILKRNGVISRPRGHSKK